MNSIIRRIEEKTTKKSNKIPHIHPGDTVQVKIKIIEGNKERSQVFEGVIIKVQRRGAGASFTVRKVSYGVGVERIFPLHSPYVEKIQIKKRGMVKRAKLYYLRKRYGKAARIKEKMWEKKLEEEILKELPESQAADETNPEGKVESK